MIDKQTQIYGNIHSIESCGTVDGPGIRFVIFLQGCPMRCKYCHNPDTWEVNDNKIISIKDIFAQYDGVKEFCKGGITVTGGEPLLQIYFVTELFKEAKKRNIHTALDTSGVTFYCHSEAKKYEILRSAQNDILAEESHNLYKFDELLKYTDLVLLDIKHIDDAEHKKLTGHSNKNILEFAKYLSEKQIPVWIRHVVVPEITFKKEYLIELGKFLKTLKNVKALDVLPYHTLGVFKYEKLGIEYPLKDVTTPTNDRIENAKKRLNA